MSSHLVRGLGKRRPEPHASLGRTFWGDTPVRDWGRPGWAETEADPKSSIMETQIGLPVARKANTRDQF